MPLHIRAVRSFLIGCCTIGSWDIQSGFMYSVQTLYTTNFFFMWKQKKKKNLQWAWATNSAAREQSWVFQKRTQPFPPQEIRFAAGLFELRRLSRMCKFTTAKANSFYNERRKSNSYPTKTKKTLLFLQGWIRSCCNILKHTSHMSEAVQAVAGIRYGWLYHDGWGADKLCITSLHVWFESCTDKHAI